MDTARFLEDDIYDEFSIQQGSKLTSICLDNLLNFGFKKQGAAGQYMKFGQSACTFRISHGFQCSLSHRHVEHYCISFATQM
jgi:hypothetical protein